LLCGIPRSAFAGHRNGLDGTIALGALAGYARNSRWSALRCIRNGIIGGRLGFSQSATCGQCPPLLPIGSLQQNERRVVSFGFSHLRHFRICEFRRASLLESLAAGLGRSAAAKFAANLSIEHQWAGVVPRKEVAMAKIVFGMNQSLDGYVDHLAFCARPHASSATSSRRLRGRRAVCTVATCMRSCVYWDDDLSLNGMRRNTPSRRRRGGTQPKWGRLAHVEVGRPPTPDLLEMMCRGRDPAS